MKIKLVVLFIISLWVSNLNAQTLFARSSGDWDIPARWSSIGTGGPSCGCTPGPGDDVLIDGYDIDIDAGTGDVTINSIIITNARGTDVRLRIQAGATLTVTTDFEIESDSGGNDAELTVVGAGSGLDILDDFLADQNAGDDLLIDIDDNAQVNIGDDCDFLQDGGDDMELNMNQNSGTAAQWNVTDDFTLDHDGGDDIRLRTDAASSLINVDGDVIVNMNTGLDDDFNFNLDAGEMNVAGDILITRADDYGPVDFDLDGGILTCNDIVINSSGALFSLGAVRFFIDEASEVNCNSLDVTFTGADDFYIHINQNAGTSAEMNVTNDVTILRIDGDDIQIFLDDDDSEMTVGGDMSITCTDGEEFDIQMDNNSTLDITGDLTITTTVAESAQIDLAGGADDPTLSVGDDFLWLNQTGNVDCLIDVNGGTFSAGDDFTLTNATGGDDMDIDLDGDGQITVGGDFLAQITGGDDLRIDIGDNVALSTAILAVTGDASIIMSSDVGPNPFWRLRIHEDTRFTVGGNLELTTDFTGTALCLVDIINTAELDVDGDIDLNAIGSGELEVRLSNNSFLRIGGDFLRAPTPNNFGEMDATGGNGTVEYKGTATQVIAEDAGGGGDSFQYMNVEIDNSFGTAPQLTMEGDATVFGDLTMNDGVVASDVTDILIVEDDGTTSNASDDSYVDGYMRKVGNDAFTFPSGNAGFYGPIGISAPTGTTHQFEAQYIWTRPDDDGFDETSLDGTLDHISLVEYWKLNRTSGASTPTVTLSWGTTRSGGVVNEADLRFARWDGAVWRDLGAASITGSPVTGTLDNSVALSAFSDSNPYTLSSIDAINPLPIELTEFTATLQDGVVALNWTTKSEINNNYFTLEKSIDGINWTAFALVDGAGNSSVEINYQELDENPYLGISYYRLKQTDFDLTTAYFGPIAVQLKDDLSVFPNPTRGMVYIVGESDPSNIKLFNIQGQEIPVQFNALNGRVLLNTKDLANGTYYLQFSTGIKRLVVQH
ncbi:MAG: T9SS type A sorting domain-containing protein [Crocinitomix sp.]|nr:T9SS type A sorting domain-containing protein [Crocinitomix sp.]